MKDLIRKILKESEDDFEWVRDIIDDDYNIISNFLNTRFDGFSDIDYSWANFNCGMGECCDIYAVGFVLPSAHYDDYLFKLVDGDNYREFGEYDNYPDELPEPCYEQPNIKDPTFDTILISEEMYEGMEDYISLDSNWKYTLLNVLNITFKIDAKKIRLDFE